MASLMRSFTSGYVNSQDDEAAADSIGYFDHVFEGKLLNFSKELGVSLSSSEEEGPRDISINCKLDFLEISEKIGSGVNVRERVALSLKFQDIGKFIWDHQNSSAKLETNAVLSVFLIIEVDNSLELEQNLSLRFSSAVKEKILPPDKIPGFAYLGMFAGPTKPKPFERKRANLTSIKQGKMPPLSLMRQIALERHRGSERPMATEVSRRKKLALDHIHDGIIAFNVFAASGAAGLSDMSCNNARLVLDDDGIVFINDVSEVGAAVASTTTRRMPLPYHDIISWTIVDNSVDVTRNGINLQCEDGIYSFAVEDVNHLRVSFEFFYNTMRITKGQPAQPGTTHGRKLVGIHTLMGETNAPPPPIGQPEVVDEDGSIVKGKPVARRKSSISVFSSNTPVPSTERISVKPHWSNVVKHNGWLLKKGGTTKSWMKRYFVLYQTSQGHFLSYYAEYWDSPLYNPSRKERNMIDLSKITYLRAKSKYRDVPPFSFDIATIEREWTLCAESSEQLKLWLQMIAYAVDVDVAIVPDDTLSFSVKAKEDPSKKLDKFDYSTILQISSWGVSVQKVVGNDREEIHFWCYTDFYKWSIVRQPRDNKMAISLQIFTSGDFKQKNDFVFRSVDSQAIATAIEYYIEKFMSRMHLRREVDELDSDGNPNSSRKTSPKTAPQKPPLKNPTTLSDSTNGASQQVEARPTPDVPNLLDDLDGAMGSGMTTQIAHLDKPEWVGSDGASPNLLDLMDEPPPPPPAAATSSPVQMKGSPAMSHNSTAELLGMMTVGSSSSSNETEKQLRSWYDVLVSTEAPGLLFKNNQVEVYYKHEYRGSQARVTLKLSNLTNETLTNVSVTLENTEPHLRSVFSGESIPTVPANGSQTYTIMMECSQPYSEPPKLNIKFNIVFLNSNQHQEFNQFLKLPVILTQFMAPATLNGSDFLARWDRLVGNGLESVVEVPSSLGNTQVAMVRLQQFKLGVAPEVAPNGNILCASTLQTGFVAADGNKVVVGCMLQITIRPNSVVIAVRTASQQVTTALSAVVAGLVQSH